METKPGWKSTEWLLSLAVVLLGALISSGLLAEGHWGLKAAGMVMAALAAMGYSAGRSRVKVAASLEAAKSDPPSE